MWHTPSFQVSLSPSRIYHHNCSLLKNGRILCIWPLKYCPPKLLRIYFMLNKMADTGWDNSLKTWFSINLHLKEVNTSDGVNIQQQQKPTLFSCWQCVTQCLNRHYITDGSVCVCLPNQTAMQDLQSVAPWLRAAGTQSTFQDRLKNLIVITIRQSFCFHLTWTENEKVV